MRAAAGSDRFDPLWRTSIHEFAPDWIKENGTILGRTTEMSRDLFRTVTVMEVHELGVLAT
jgi:hypothetical protein